MKVLAPAVFEEEWLRLWNAAWEAFPEPDVEGLPDDTADAVLDTNIGKVHEYIHQHMSPLLREFDEYYNGRFADEGELYDKDGLSFVMDENGLMKLEPITTEKEWKVIEMTLKVLQDRLKENKEE